MAPHLTDKERQRILGYLRDGKSQSWTAKKVGRSKDTIGRIGRDAGIQSDVRKTKKATAASAAFREIDRMEVISEILDVGQRLLEGIIEPRDYKDVVTGLAIGIDKHRLETGEVTNRTENRASEASLETEFAKLDRELDRGLEEERASSVVEEEPEESSP